MSVSRRNLLRGGLLATASIPFARWQQTLDAWNVSEEALRSAPGGAPVVRLSHNENPYGPSDAAREAIMEAISLGNRYPIEPINALVEAIAAKEHVNPDQVLITAGSLELLGVVGLMAGIHKGRVISSNPTFDFMCRFAEQLSAEWIKVPLTEDHQYNLRDINKHVNDDTKLVFVCNPNNPTGAELPSAVLHPFCQTLAERCMVYVDEAYIEMSNEGPSASMARMTSSLPNLVVGRTFSKIYGLAGLRVGYAIGHKATIEKIRNNLQGRGVTPSACSVAAAKASLEDQAFVDFCMEMNGKCKQLVYDKFDAWGVEYIPSSTNFIFFKTDLFNCTDIRRSLAESNVLIRNYSSVPGWARVSTGTPEEMEKFLDAASQFIA